MSQPLNFNTRLRPHFEIFPGSPAAAACSAILGLWGTVIAMCLPTALPPLRLHRSTEPARVASEGARSAVEADVSVIALLPPLGLMLASVSRAGRSRELPSAPSVLSIDPALADLLFGARSWEWGWPGSPSFISRYLQLGAGGLGSDEVGRSPTPSSAAILHA